MDAISVSKRQKQLPVVLGAVRHEDIYQTFGPIGGWCEEDSCHRSEWLLYLQDGTWLQVHSHHWGSSQGHPEKVPLGHYGSISKELSEEEALLWLIDNEIRPSQPVRCLLKLRHLRRRLPPRGPLVVLPRGPVSLFDSAGNKRDKHVSH